MTDNAFAAGKRLRQLTIKRWLSRLFYGVMAVVIYALLYVGAAVMSAVPS